MVRGTSARSALPRLPAGDPAALLALGCQPPSMPTARGPGGERGTSSGPSATERAASASTGSASSGDLSGTGGSGDAGKGHADAGMR